jgi:hypothetical protein
MIDWWRGRGVAIVTLTVFQRGKKAGESFFSSIQETTEIPPDIFS